MSNVSLIDGHIENVNRCVSCGAIIPEGKQVCPICEKKQVEYRCKYCGNKAQKYGHICAACYQKLKTIRELLKLVNHIKEKAREEPKRGNMPGTYYCSSCKAVVKRGDRYCSSCGQHLSWR